MLHLTHVTSQEVTCDTFDFLRCLGITGLLRVDVRGAVSVRSDRRELHMHTETSDSVQRRRILSGHPKFWNEVEIL